MTAPANFYADFKGLAELKHAAGQQDPKVLREAARQFESIFTKMMLKSMRDASLGESLMDNDQSKFYLEMFDNQLAVELSKGRGLGLAEMMVKQLTQAGVGGPRTSDVKPVDGRPLVETTGVVTRDASRVTALEKKVELSAEQPSASDSIPTHHASRVTGHEPSDPPRHASRVTGHDPSDPLRHASRVTRHDSVASTASTVNPKNSPATETAVMTPDEFVRNMWSHAQAAGRELGVDPQTLIAHAALETGWGKSIPCNADGTCSYNLFGIKAGGKWQGESVRVNTLEFEDGVAVRKRENFRAYASPADSFKDYAALLKNSPRYQAALGAGSDAEKFATALQNGGYATDPNYAQKLAKTAVGVVERVGTLLKSATAQPISSVVARVVEGGLNARK